MIRRKLVGQRDQFVGRFLFQFVHRGAVDHLVARRLDLLDRFELLRHRRSDRANAIVPSFTISNGPRHLANDGVDLVRLAATSVVGEELGAEDVAELLFEPRPELTFARLRLAHPLADRAAGFVGVDFPLSGSLCQCARLLFDHEARRLPPRQFPIGDCLVCALLQIIGERRDLPLYVVLQRRDKLRIGRNLPSRLPDPLFHCGRDRLRLFVDHLRRIADVHQIRHFHDVLIFQRRKSFAAHAVGINVSLRRFLKRRGGIAQNLHHCAEWFSVDVVLRARLPRRIDVGVERLDTPALWVGH